MSGIIVAAVLIVLVVLLLTTVATLVLLAETRTISQFAALAADPAASGDDFWALGSILVHSVGGTVVLLVILVLNVYKPRGLTRYRVAEGGAAQDCAAAGSALTKS